VMKVARLGRRGVKANGRVYGRMTANDWVALTVAQIARVGPSRRTMPYGASSPGQSRTVRQLPTSMVSTTLA
jgi:hypothetical protein